MTIVLLILGLLPASRPKNRLLALVGRRWSVAATARIHPVLLWRVRALTLEQHAYLGPGSIFRDMERVHLGAYAGIGQFNWFSGAAADAITDDPGESAASLVMEYGAAITSRHYVDCSGGLRMGPAAVLGGVRSTVLTHSIEPRTWVQQLRPVAFEAGALVLSNCLVNAGMTIPAESVVASGATVATRLETTRTLYGGVPARPIGDMSDAAAFLARPTMRGGAAAVRDARGTAGR